MYISRFKPGDNDTFDETLEEIKIREDIENLSVEDFIDALTSTITKDTTIDMILQNLERAYDVIIDYKRDRICNILFMKSTYAFLKEKEQKTKPVEVIE